MDFNLNKYLKIMQCPKCFLLNIFLPECVMIIDQRFHNKIMVARIKLTKFNLGFLFTLAPEPRFTYNMNACTIMYYP